MTRAEDVDGGEGRDRRRLEHLRSHQLVTLALLRLSPAVWGLPLLLDELREHPRLLLYGLLYAAWVALGGVTLVAGPSSWPARTGRLAIGFLWSYLVLVSLT